MHRLIRSVPVVLLLASLALLGFSRRGQTVPKYAAMTGNLCRTCHFDPNGGGPRNEFGFAYARKRHSLDDEPEGNPWKDLTLTNRVGENMPLYFGVNQRFMLLTNSAGPPSGVDRLGFFNMENAIHTAFQPHSQLTLVYSFDAFGAGPTAGAVNRDAFGMITGGPWNSYLKAGRFRNPFGLRMDDHTVATRNGFLDFSTGEGFLPYDPRLPDMGIEVGADHGSVYGRMAYTNGNVNVFAGQNAETKAIKVGVNMPGYQSGLSFYDQFNGTPIGGRKRATRWGYFGMGHLGHLSVLGEIVAGTDEAEPLPPFATGPKTNRLAYFAEANYAVYRYLNLSARYDRLVMDRSSNSVVRDASTHDRYSFEVDYVPVPFAELRGTVRQIVQGDETLFGFEDETQGSLQFHFSY